MNLIEFLIKENNVKKLNHKTKMTVKILSGKEITGLYDGYTSELDNESKKASLGIIAEKIYYELYEDEIELIEVLK